MLVMSVLQEDEERREALLLLAELDAEQGQLQVHPLPLLASLAHFLPTRPSQVLVHILCVALVAQML